MSLAQANKERTRIKLSAEEHPEDAAIALPVQLLELIARSKKLQDQVRRLDATIHAPPHAPTGSNPFECQLGMLRAAFERRPL